MIALIREDVNNTEEFILIVLTYFNSFIIIFTRKQKKNKSCSSNYKMSKVFNSFI